MDRDELEKEEREKGGGCGVQMNRNTHVMKETLR